MNSNLILELVGNNFLRMLLFFLQRFSFTSAELSLSLTKQISIKWLLYSTVNWSPPSSSLRDLSFNFRWTRLYV